MYLVKGCSEKDFNAASENGKYHSMNVFGEDTRGFKYNNKFYYKNFSRNVYYEVSGL